MGIFDFERLFDLNHDGTLDPLEKGLEFTAIMTTCFRLIQMMNLTRISTMISDFIQQTI